MGLLSDLLNRKKIKELEDAQRRKDSMDFINTLLNRGQVEIVGTPETKFSVDERGFFDRSTPVQGPTRPGQTLPPLVQSGLEFRKPAAKKDATTKKKVYIFNESSGEFKESDIPAGTDVEVFKFDPSKKALSKKDTLTEKVALEVYDAFIRAQTDPAYQMTDTLQKNVEMIAPVLGLEKVQEPDTTEKGLFGRKRKIPGLTYYKPKGTKGPVNIESEARKELEAAGLPLTPANIKEAIRQLKAQGR